MKRLMVVVLTAIGILSAQSLEDRVQSLANSITDNAASLISSGYLSNAGCRGGLPHFNIGAGVNLNWFKFENPLNTSEKILFPAIFPYLYGEVGIFKGSSFTPLLRGLLAVDIVGKYAPTLVKISYFEESPQLISYGVKVQILKDQLIPPTPALSVTILNNMYQTLTLKFDTLHTSLKLNDLSVRAAVSKNVLFLTPFLGIAYDTYSLKTNYWTDGDPNKKPVADVKNSKLSYFGGVEFKFLVVKGYIEGQYRNSKVGLTFGIKAGI